MSETENNAPEKSEKKDGYVKRMTNPSQRQKRATASKREKNPVLFIILIIGLVVLAGVLVFLFFLK